MKRFSMRLGKPETTFVWRQIRSVEHLGEVRQRAMKQFLGDFPSGVQQGRYRIGELPNLPFSYDEFDLALRSHFLFTYSNVLSLEFHLERCGDESEDSS
jgi:hypothetical protein